MSTCAGKEPVSRKFQSLTAMSSHMVMFGGQSLEDSADLNDLFFLRKVLLSSRNQCLVVCDVTGGRFHAYTHGCTQATLTA